MERRHFFTTMAKGVATTLLVAGCHSPEKVSQAQHAASDFRTRIFVPGLKTKLRVLHVTDTHLSVFDEQEKEFHSFGARMDQAFLDREHYKTSQKINSITAFHELMALAKNQPFDLIVLTGDIVNNPSRASVRFVREELEKTGIPWLYVAGNHDWHYEGMTGTADELRQTWIHNSLMPLYDANPLFSAREINGLNFVRIDNSTYQISEDQLAFFQAQMALPAPMVLLMHIPVYVPEDGTDEDVGTCGDPRWGAEHDGNYIIERRQQWRKEGNFPATVEFVASVKKSENLIAALVGHSHRARMDTLAPNAIQYTTGGGYNGRYRIVEFQPLV